MKKVDDEPRPQPLQKNDVELLKLSIAGNTLMALFKSRPIFAEIGEKILDAEKITMIFHHNVVSLYVANHGFDEDILIGDFAMTYFNDKLVEISTLRIYVSAIKNDLLALFFAHADSFARARFDVCLHLIQNEFGSSSWISIILDGTSYIIDFLEFDYKRSQMTIPTDDGVLNPPAEVKCFPIPREKLQSERVVENHQPPIPNREKIAEQAEQPEQPRKPIILPKLEPDTKTKANDEDLCKVCMENDLRTINLPCGCMFFCIKCSHEYIQQQNKIEKTNSCPSCQQVITEIKKVFR